MLQRRLFLTKFFEMLRIRSFVFNPFQENTYVVYDETLECVIVDPGNAETSEHAELKQFIEDEKLKVKLILNTHCHVDHVLGNRFVRETWKINLLIPTGEQSVLKAAEVYAPSYGFHDYVHQPADAFLEDGDEVMFGNQVLLVLLVPGHSPGHVAFYHKREGVLLGGDVLFYNSIGRTDLPGGNHQQLLHSIQTRIFTLPESVKVLPGHGPETSIGFEKRTNPFCAVRPEPQ